MSYSEYAKAMKAMGDKTRVTIFDMLRNGPLCACEILEKLSITQPTLSHHMKILCGCELVLATKDWKWTYYKINCEKLNQIIGFMGDTKCRRSESF